MKKILFLLLTLLLISALNAEWTDIEENKGKELFDHSSSGKEHTEINFSLNGYNIETIKENDTDFQKISYWKDGNSLEVGKPDLPKFTKLISIPNEGSVSFEIIYTKDEIVENIEVYPTQELQIENEIVSHKFVIDEDYYNNGSVFPANVVEIGEPVIMRDQRVVSVSINPFQYDAQAKTLRIIKNVDVVVNASGRGGINPKTHDKKISRFFEPIYRSSILNYDSVTERDVEYQDPSYLFIYADETNVLSNLDSLSYWKHQKGFDVTLASTTEAGTTTTSIKNYIQNAYDTWPDPPEFVCLVGDANGTYTIPTYTETWSGYGGEGDHPYSQLEGGDILADVILGRISISSLTDLQTYVYKVLYYEKYPNMDETDWYNKSLMVGDPASGSGPSTIFTNQSIIEMMQLHAPNIVATEVYTSPFSSAMTNNLNSGVSYFNYRGWLNMSQFYNTDIDALTNSNKLPFAVILTCDTGSFEGTSRSEAFIRAGSAGNQIGAIAAIGTATSGTHTNFNNSVDAGIYHGIFADGIYNPGGAVNRGKLALYEHYPQNPSNRVEITSHWNTLMGDPGVELWTAIPQLIVANYETVISPGTTYLEVTVENNLGTPLEGAWVTALMGDDEIFATGYTDENGLVVLAIDATLEGSAHLTVTKHNYIPHLGGFDVGEVDRFVNVLEVTIDDDNSGSSSGNNDGLINPGETIELNVNLKNFGTETANSVTATITTENAFVTISDDTESFGSITSGGTAFCTDDFDISIDADVLGSTEIRLDIVITDALANTWNDMIFLVVEGANLDVTDYSIIELGNGYLDPGETADMSVTLQNNGLVTANAVYGDITSLDSRVTVSDANGYFGNITGAGGQGSNTSDVFEVTASAQLVVGTQIMMELHLYNASGYDSTVQFLLGIGEVSITDPVGPDAYGYFCYDDGDIGYDSVPTYDWIEINSIGTDLDLSDPGDTGDIETITNLPITFRMYGEEYDSITVCSNGWIAPGGSTQASFMNSPIPGPQGPSPMIAPFWDDLKVGSGGVYWQYNSLLHAVIIEWDNLQNDEDGLEETFQVILYDAINNPTNTGDSEIKFQYKIVNNTSSGNYPYEHGQYASVGIEDPTGTIGLEYTFNNNYPTAAKELQNEMALFITTSPIPSGVPYLTLGEIVITDENGNGLVDYGEDVSLDIPLNNVGDSAATGISATLLTLDTYITITAGSSSYNNIEGENSGVNLTDYEFTVAEDCPDGHLAYFYLNATSNEDSWNLNFSLEVNAPKIEYSSVFVDDGDNNMLDPGETCNIDVTFTNNGGAYAYNAGVVISETDPYITLNGPTTHDFGTFSSGQFQTATFNLTVSPSAPIGYSADINWDITADYSYYANDVFSMFIGLIIEDFETGDFSQYSWGFGGDADWIVVTDTTYEGTYSAKSGLITDNQTTELIINVDVVTDGTISFYRKVSSENNYDDFRFYIDNDLKGEWNGEVYWSEVSYPVTAGNHTFKWHYYKDGSQSNGSDCAWIDYIIFPELGSPQPVFDLAPTSIDFGDVAVGSSSTEQFTISNPGGATLTGNITTPAGYSVAAADNIVLGSQITKGENNSDNTIGYSIPALSNQTFDLMFSPVAAITYNGNVVITSNDTNNPTNDLSVTGVGYVPAEITVDPLLYEVTLQPGESIPDELTIGNLGGVTLDYTARVVYLERITNLEDNNISSGINYSDREIKTPIIAPLIKKVSNSDNRDCTFTVDLYDDYGDGWNGGSLDVLVNSFVVLDDITLDAGAGPVSFDIPIVTGDMVSTIFTPDGWPYECSYFIYDNDGVQVASDGTGGVDPTGISPFAVTCTNDPTLSWLTLDELNQVSGSIDSGSPDDVIGVLFDTLPDALTVGSYEADIEITHNDPDQPTITVDVTLTVSQQLDVPQNVTIVTTPNGADVDVLISWTAVLGATSYTVYRSDNPYAEFPSGWTAEPVMTGTTWSYTTSRTQRFYRVTANN